MQVENLLPVEYRGERVLSTRQIASAYGCPIQNIRWNFADNKDKFVEGIHYFRIEGAALKDFKEYVVKLVAQRKESGKTIPVELPYGVKLNSLDTSGRGTSLQNSQYSAGLGYV